MGYIDKKVIGKCTIYLGDAVSLYKSIRGEFQSVVTDPPYGMKFLSNHRKVKYNDIKNDGDTNLLVWATEIEARHSKYIFHRWDNIYDVAKPKSLITWVKNNHSMGDLKHEHGRKTEVISFYRGPEHFFPGKRPNDVVMHPRTGNVHHPTEKPISLMKEVVSWTDGVVFDPFMGSGSTAIACIELGREFIGVEIDEVHYKKTIERLTDRLNKDGQA